MSRVLVAAEPGSLEEAFRAGAAASSLSSGVRLWWLGQAGFAIGGGGLRLLIDPYLSDSLAQKYAGKPFPHIRMMPAPLTAERAAGLDAVLCTHGHSDHMDPGTLPALAAGNPRCLFIAPRAEAAKAVERGVPPERLLGLADGESLDPVQGLSIRAIASAHEERKRNESGDDLFLGFVIALGGVSIYHSGDCVPYSGLVEKLAPYRVDAALLPINGRDERRRAGGIPGNFTLTEAVSICRSARIPSLICHHFGMFDFNTVDAEAERKKASALGGAVQILFAETSVRYEVAAVQIMGQEWSAAVSLQ